ncbi:signal recognition particle-docking protein FtsY [Candidatus Woesearchaeota archaeon]|nr:signal recognition particle-docking protein FtsY [Candidatus Woesearchaeota archaeon]|tara:strand:+ start:73 stop:1779 length:1707 start_codon:yes stop_codon:yes gene_type:complete
MFKFLKGKLKGAISKFSKKVEEEVKEEEQVEKESIKEKAIEEGPIEELSRTTSSLPMTRAEALELVKKYNKDISDLNHYLESEAIMKALAKKLGEDEEYWAMLGLLHDVDWGITKENTKDHLTKSSEILKQAGFDDNFINIVISHGYGFDCAGLKDKQRTQKIEYALACSETITGLIHAYALMKGSIEDIELKGLKKKFKDKNFAAAVNRDIIRECEKLGLELSEFFDLVIDAVKSVASEVGLAKEETIKEKTIEEKPIEEKETIKDEKPEPTEEKKGFFSKFTEKISTTKISYDKFEKLFSDLELILMENNVAMEVIDKIKNDLAQNMVEKPIKRTKIEETIKESLKNSIDELFDVEKVDLWSSIKTKEEKPFVIAFFGINGSGKTTTIAKVANMLKEKNISCVLAASDTFRAASIEQLQHHADKLGIKLIKHDYGSDPAAVAFDAVKHAKSKDIDVVLVDTAGRLHSQKNLIEEMKKIIRIAKPDLKIFVGEAITGNDCVEQAKSFDEAVGIDGLILSKADVDEKGGAAISVSYVTKKPIMYFGVGQEYSDLKKFEANIVVEGLGL